MLIEILIGAMLLGLIPAFIAKSKGGSFGGMWILGTLLFIFALPIALLSKDQRRRCPHCAEPVQPAANVCPHCQRELTIQEGSPA